MASLISYLLRRLRRISESKAAIAGALLVVFVVGAFGRALHRGTARSVGALGLAAIGALIGAAWPIRTRGSDQANG